MVQGRQVTTEGLEKLKEELKKLRSTDRPAVVKRMADAREIGDLSENADYHDAREQLAFIEGRIQELESTIRHAQIVSRITGENDSVQIGSKITVKVNNKTVNFEVVGANEGDPAIGKLSVESPVGVALIGKKVGEKVDVMTPSGKVQYSIASIA
jgi:transcription elongation factor GreA